jgi:peroxiredoxin
MTPAAGDRAPDFDLEGEGHARVTLAGFAGRSNVLLVFHPYVFTPICAEEAQDLQANLQSFRDAETEVVFVSCDSAPARKAFKESLGATYEFAADFWEHGAVARAYGVFDEELGVSLRGTFLIDKEGTVIWSLVKGLGEKRELMAEQSLGTLTDHA